MTTERRWATAVRVLALLSLILGTVAVLEGMTVRRARMELRQLRQEREDVKTALAGTWARQSAAEVGQAIGALDAFYADTTDGVGRRGGLCADGHLDVAPIATFVMGTYLPARAQGRSDSAAADAMRAAIRASAPSNLAPATMPPVK
jgi:hypothetical protein